MRLASARPVGSRLRGRPVTKVRGVHLGGRPDVDYGTPGPGESGWTSFWTTLFDWDALTEDVDRAVAIGANNVKLMADITRYFVGGAARDLMNHRMRMFLDYTRDSGVTVHWAQQVPIWYGDAYEEGIAAMVEMVQVLDEYPHVIGFDCLSEINFYAPANLIHLDLEALFVPLREVSTMPLGAGLSGNPSTMDAYLEALAPWVDYFDFHDYEMASPSHLDEFRAAYGKPFLLGEFGLGGYSSPTDTTQQLVEFGQPVSEMPDCYGTIWFPQYDALELDAGYPGLLAVDGTPHAAPSAAFAAQAGWT